MNALRTCSALLAALLATLLLTPGTAFAHAGLSDSSPGEKDVVDALPEQVTLEFSEEVREPAFVVVTGPDGRTHESGKPALDGNTATQDVEAPATGSTSGEWTIGYRVVSADGHPVTGHVRFRVAAPATPSGSPDASGSTSVDPSPSVLAPDETLSPTKSDDEDDTSGSAPVFIAALLAALLVAVAAVTARRKRDRS